MNVVCYYRHTKVGGEISVGEIIVVGIVVLFKIGVGIA